MMAIQNIFQSFHAMLYGSFPENGDLGQVGILSKIKTSANSCFIWMQKTYLVRIQPTSHSIQQLIINHRWGIGIGIATIGFFAIAALCILRQILKRRIANRSQNHATLSRDPFTNPLSVSRRVPIDQNSKTQANQLVNRTNALAANSGMIDNRHNLFLQIHSIRKVEKEDSFPVLDISASGSLLPVIIMDSLSGFSSMYGDCVYGSSEQRSSKQWIAQVNELERQLKIRTNATNSFPEPSKEFNEFVARQRLAKFTTAELAMIVFFTHQGNLGEEYAAYGQLIETLKNVKQPSIFSEASDEEDNVSIWLAFVVKHYNKESVKKDWNSALNSQGWRSNVCIIALKERLRSHLPVPDPIQNVTALPLKVEKVLYSNLSNGSVELSVEQLLEKQLNAKRRYIENTPVKVKGDTSTAPTTPGFD